ncbi:MAG: response regulator [Rhodospirillaceae bacterium]|nr:response regulator [Rhodospirillaceae bacterium]
MNRLIGRAGLLAFYAAALSAAGWFLATKLDTARDEIQHERLAALDAVQSQLSLSMVAAQSYVELLQTTVQNELAVRPPVAPPSVLLSAVKADANGVFSLDRLPPSIDRKDIGNLTGFGGLKGRDDYFRKEMEVALSLRSAVARIIGNLPNAAWVYYVSGSRFEHVYPWVPSTQAAYKDEDLGQQYFLRGMPENNPTRAPYYTDIYDDDFGKGLMITMGRPVYDGDRFTGIIGLDFTLGSLDGILAHFPRRFGEIYLVDAKKTVIGYSLRTDSKEAVTLPASAAADAALTEAFTEPRVAEENGRIVATQKIQVLPFTLVAMAPKADLWTQTIGRSAVEIAAFLVVLALLAFLEWRRRAARELVEAKNQAEQATRSKSSFLAMMSHEIRTPMNGVMSMAEMLDQTDLSDDQRGMTSVIRSSAAALLTIINDILDFSKIEAGRLDIEKTSFSLIDVVESAGELMSPRADDKGLTLATIIDPACPTALVGDPARVRQMMLNLVGNALKFTEEGSVTVRARLAEGAHAEGSRAGRAIIHFEVTDTGIGLTPEQQGRLFKAFAQADVSTSRKYGGTGLGLSISQRLCELMQGRIGVTSEIGRGSTFWFELPFDLGDETAPAPIDIHDAAVVAIGFDGPTRAAMETILAAHSVTNATWLGYGDDIVLPRSDETTTVFLSARHGDAPTLDIGRALIERAHREDVKFALVAPRALVSTLTEAESAGFFAALTLPLRRARTGQTIAAAMGRAELGQRTAAADETAQYSPPPVEEARRAGVLILAAEDNATNRIVIKRMLSQRGYAVEIAGNGVEALARYDADPNYGLLLTDFHMPEMDGFALTAEIRERERGTERKLPIVALTADALPGTAQRCLASGMDGYLTKPIDSKALTATLEKWLPGAAALRQTALRRSKKDEAVKIDPQIFDMARFTETFGPLTAGTRAALAQFLIDAGKMAAAINAAMAAEDWAEARHQAHALKGAGASIGAARLGQLASDVQDCLDASDPDTAGLFTGGLDTTVDELAQAVRPLMKE